jgi:hypothetical protein
MIMVMVLRFQPNDLHFIDKYSTVLAMPPLIFTFSYVFLHCDPPIMGIIISLNWQACANMLLIFLSDWELRIMSGPPTDPL